MPVGCNASLARKIAVTKVATVSGNVGVRAVASISFARPGIFTATSSPVPKLQRLLARAFSASQPQAATVAKQPQKPLAVTVTPVAAAARAKVYALILATTQKVGHGVKTVSLTATQAQAATLAAIRVVTKTVTATQPQTATFQRQPGKQLRTGSMLALPPIFQSVATSAAIQMLRTPGKVFAATVAQAATLRRQTAHEVDAAQPQTATARRATARTLATATQPQAATLTRLRGLPLNAAVAQAATVQRQAQTRLAAIQQTQADLDLQSGRTFTAAANALANLSAQKVAKLATIAATVTTTATTRRDVSRTLIADPVTTSALLVNLAAIRLTIATVGQTAAFAIAAAKHLDAFQAQAATLRRNPTLAALRATIAPTAVLLRNPTRILTLRATVKARARFFTDHPALYGIIRAGRVAVAEVGHIARAVRGRVETIIERLS